MLRQLRGRALGESIPTRSFAIPETDCMLSALLYLAFPRTLQEETVEVSGFEEKKSAFSRWIDMLRIVFDRVR